MSYVDELPPRTRVIRVPAFKPDPNQTTIDEVLTGERVEPGPPEGSIQARFERFHAENPQVYAELVRLAREWRDAGNTKCGISMLFEVLRWRLGLRLPVGVSPEFAWAVGLFEGEGTFFCKDEGRRQRRMTFGSTDVEVVRRFHGVVRVGRVTGPYSRPDRKPYWRWSLDRWDDLEPLVTAMLPLLSPRRAEAAQKILDHPALSQGGDHKPRPAAQRRPFALNNNYRSRYARKIAAEHPDLAPMFDTRELLTA